MLKEGKDILFMLRINKTKHKQDMTEFLWALTSVIQSFQKCIEILKENISDQIDYQIYYDTYFHTTKYVLVLICYFFPL